MNGIKEHDHDLEDHIKTLRELDQYRRESAKLREEGFKALDAWIIDPGETPPPLIRRSLLIKAYSKRRGWDKVENKAEIKSKLEGFQEGLQELTLGNIKGKSPPSGLPSPDSQLSIFSAALLLQALTSVPGLAYSRTAFFCLYWIIRELHSGSYPDWGIGGARAAPDGSVTAFTTGECVYAILSFHDAQKNVNEFFRHLRDFVIAKNRLDNMGEALEKWKEKEKERLRLSYHFTFQALKCEFSLSEAFCDKFYERYSDSSTGFEEFLSELKKEIAQIKKNAEEAIINIKDTWKIEKSDKEDEIADKEDPKYRSFLEYKLMATQAAHHFSLNVIQDIDRNVGDILALLNSEKNDHEKLKNICHKVENICDKTNQDLHKTLHPTLHYLSTVLDHQLALAAASGNRQWEPSELVCAAAAYGRLTGEWNTDYRFQEAVLRLENRLSDRGMFPHSVPFHAIEEGFCFPLNADLLHSYTQLLRHAKRKDNGIEPELVNRMLRFFRDTRATHPPGRETDKKEKGWRHEHTPPPYRFNPGATCYATLALARINELLDEQINEIILEHFTKREASQKLNLDTLFYPDYGLSLIPEKILDPPDFLDQSEWPTSGFHRDESIAFTLQRMRAHVTGADFPEEKKDKKLPCKFDTLHSLVLHGPPGTGKTTLVEALASSCGKKLVEVTPSDIVKEGEAAIERRARTVFEALSLLTRVVILFDEFDPVLWGRDPNDSSTRTVFSFLTPGMLPKLKELNEQAENRGVAYVLGTNLIGGLDEAAVREGRFDEKMGIYPPDILSRLGRFMDQVEKMNQEKVNRGEEMSQGKETQKPNEKRLCEVIQKTGNASMPVLGKPGWFTAPKDKGNYKPNTLFDLAAARANW